MSAYTRAYQGLTRGGMPERMVAQLLAEVPAQFGEELSHGLRAWAAEKYSAEPTDTGAIERRKKAKRGAAHAAADWIRRASTKRPTSHQPTEKSG
ncbi:hypothetical protein ACFXCZ_27350 [Streptomyces sp. NPDC059396]|uniref:hypothetical protein n=1 Tax=Streptomyces sp. NPDC059396 TaxID=3346819 RepID=UPI0036879673